ncbi:MAG: hypothetical protein V1809_10225 [Planctomycetota bacterium]
MATDALSNILTSMLAPAQIQATKDAKVLKSAQEIQKTEMDALIGMLQEMGIGRNVDLYG